MNIAVVGGNGFIGKEFVNYASSKGHLVFVIGSEYNVYDDYGENTVKSILKKCDAMVFLAAKRHVSTFSMEDYLYNIRIADKYLSLSVETSVKNVVVTSSISVYSNNVIPWRETDFQAPLSLYGASKQAVDSLALFYNEQQGMKIKSLRLAQVIGLGERKGFLLNTIIDKAIAKEKQTVYGKGLGRRQYIYIKDVCDAILHAVTKECDSSGIFNIGMEYNVAIADLVQMVNEVFDNDAGVGFLLDKSEDMNEYLMDVSKIEREFKWKPQYDLRSAFMDIKKQCLES